MVQDWEKELRLPWLAKVPLDELIIPYLVEANVDFCRCSDLLTNLLKVSWV
jgi:hypothetical protein